MPGSIAARKGRGAASNDSGRFEAEQRAGFDDGWGSADAEPMPLATHLERRRDAHDHRPQRLAGHRLRPLDQPLSRLRAWLHLLLCAAEPRLSRPVARPRFRKPAVLQAAGGGPARPPNCAKRAMPAARSRSAATPTPTSRSSAGSRSPAAILEVLRDFRHPVIDHHQIGADPARPRHPRRDGEGPAGDGRDLGDDIGSRAGAGDGAARGDARAPPRNHRRTWPLPGCRPASCSRR